MVGDGSLIARVVSIGRGTNTWAKGCVMIFDRINGGSISPDVKTWSQTGQTVIVMTSHAAGQDRTFELDGIAASPCRGWGPCRSAKCATVARSKS